MINLLALEGERLCSERRIVSPGPAMQSEGVEGKGPLLLPQFRVPGEGCVEAGGSGSSQDRRQHSPVREAGVQHRPAPAQHGSRQPAGEGHPQLIISMRERSCEGPGDVWP